MVHPIADQSQFWDVQDSRIARGWWGLVHQWQGRPQPAELAAHALGGKIIAVTDPMGATIAAPIAGQSLGPIVIELAGQVLKMQVQNTGTSTWYGYRSAVAQGEIQGRGQLYNSANQVVQDVRFYIRDNTPPGQIAEAIGFLSFPDVSGRYRLELDLIRNGGAPLVDSQWLDPAGQLRPLTLQNQGWRQYGQQIQVRASVPTATTNREINLPLQITNQSNFVWRSQGLYPVNLSYRWRRSAQGQLPQTELPQPGIRTTLATALPAGRSGNLMATVKTPATPGQYQLVWSLLEEGNAWFDDLGAPGLTLPVTVKAP
jgi:hypothetical protein